MTDRIEYHVNSLDSETIAKAISISGEALSLNEFGKKAALVYASNLINGSVQTEISKRERLKDETLEVNLALKKVLLEISQEKLEFMRENHASSFNEQSDKAARKTTENEVWVGRNYQETHNVTPERSKESKPFREFFHENGKTATNLILWECNNSNCAYQTNDKEFAKIHIGSHYPYSNISD